MPEQNTELARWFADVARDLESRNGLDETLHRVCRLAVDSVDGCESAGISLVHRGGHVDTPAATDARSKIVHDVQNELGEGPCITSISDEPISQADDLSNDPRWPRFTARIAHTGVRSSLSFQLFTQEDVLGALNLFSTRPYAFDTDDREVGRILAAHAAVALAAARAKAQLSQSIASRQRIGEATGILAERHGITTTEAFRLLAAASQNRNIKLRDLAERLVAGEDRERHR